MPKSDKQNSDSNGELPVGWNVWPGVNEATRILQGAGNAPVSHHFLYQKVAEGALRQIIDPKGTKRFDPADLDALRSYVTTADEDELAAPAPRRKNAGGITPEAFNAGTELVTTVLAWHQKMVPLMISGFEAASRRAEEQSNRDRDELERQRSRNAELEKMRDDTAKEREAALRSENEQRLAERMVDAQEKRKDRAMSVVESKLLPILAQKFGLTDPKMGLGIKLLSSVTREQMLMLAHPGLLEEPQRLIVLQLLGELSAEEKTALGVTTESETEKGK